MYRKQDNFLANMCIYTYKEVSVNKRIKFDNKNAGMMMLGAVEETSIAEAASLFDTNVSGILRTTKALLPHMRTQNSGRIINISSVLGFLRKDFGLG
jgi:NADP-dependent 3-hydroxy acid dehydrogenase YdfG